VRRLLLWAIAASLLVSAVVTTVSLLQTPKYEASAVRLVDAQVKSDGRPHPIPTTTFGTLEHVARKTAVASGSRPVAAETIRRLGLEMSPDKLLDNLTVDRNEDSLFIQLTYTDTDPRRAQDVANTVGQMASERVPDVCETQACHTTAIVFKKAQPPTTPASPKPLRNGLLALVATLSLSTALIAARAYLRGS
jgi:non-specific protein-tyrosine kinase